MEESLESANVTLRIDLGIIKLFVLYLYVHLIY